MEALGFAMYLAAVAVVGVAASKRGLSGWLYAIMCIVGGPIVVMIVGSGGGSGVAAAFAAFMVPAGALFMAMASKTDEAKASDGENSTGYKKCPFCAESIRKEATKCRHCGSDLLPAPASSATVNAGESAA